MSDYNNDGDLVTIVDDDGQEFELEYIDEIDYNGSTFVAFLPANMDETGRRIQQIYGSPFR